jgi:protocatechuate 3,4-dioxygenase beta subunit
LISGTPTIGANTTTLDFGIVATSSPVQTALFTFIRAIYSGRTRHYHVKVQAPGSRLLTTQIYFPSEPANRRDGLFRRELLMRVADLGDSVLGQFDFVLDIR